MSSSANIIQVLTINPVLLTNLSQLLSVFYSINFGVFDVALPTPRFPLLNVVQEGPSRNSVTNSSKQWNNIILWDSRAQETRTRPPNLITLW